MPKSLEEVKADALALSHEEIDQLIDDLLQARSGESMDAEREQIESTLQDRLEGPFIKIEDPEAHIEERRRHYRELYRKATNG